MKILIIIIMLTTTVVMNAKKNGIYSEFGEFSDREVRHLMNGNFIKNIINKKKKRASVVDKWNEKIDFYKRLSNSGKIEKDKTYLYKNYKMKQKIGKIKTNWYKPQSMKKTKNDSIYEIVNKFIQQLNNGEYIKLKEWVKPEIVSYAYMILENMSMRKSFSEEELISLFNKIKKIPRNTINLTEEHLKMASDKLFEDTINIMRKEEKYKLFKETMGEIQMISGIKQIRLDVKRVKTIIISKDIEDYKKNPTMMFVEVVNTDDGLKINNIYFDYPLNHVKEAKKIKKK